MRAFSVPSSASANAPATAGYAQTPIEPVRRDENGLPLFQPFGAQAFMEAHTRHVPVFLWIGELDEALAEASLCAQIAERTVPVHLPLGMRPDVELLCQQASALFSQEGALPLCALLLPDGAPFLAAPLPPAGFPLDPSRLFVWLTQADRRFTQNLPALAGQAAQAVQSLRAPAPRKPYSPQDAAHDLLRALSAVEDTHNGGFGGIKSPLPCALLALQHAASRGDRSARAALNRALDAMLASALYDPLDGSFFRATLTEDWRVFVPEKPLGINALLALVLLENGRRSEAVRALDALVTSFSLQGGGFTPALRAPRETYAFTPEQACAALGSEEGLRACRLLGLLRQHSRPDPVIAPSRFSPVPPSERSRPALEDDDAPLCPRLSADATPEDAAFLRRVLPKLLRARSAREPQRVMPCMITQECAIAAAVLALCGRRLGETRYTQAAQRAVSRLTALSPASGAFTALPPSYVPAGALYAQATCGAAAALALALLTLGQDEGMQTYAQGGLQLLGSSLHAFLRRDGMPMHTPEDPAAFFPRVPAVLDDELPSPAALLVQALRLADAMRPEAHYAQAIGEIWEAAAPMAHASPLSCAGLIDAMQA